MVTREIKQQQTLAELSCADVEHAQVVMKEVIDQVSILINNNILHLDLHPGNVLVDSRDRVFLLDFDRGSLSRQNKNKLRDHYLRRWRRAVVKHQLPEMLSQMMYTGLQKGYEVE